MKKTAIAAVAASIAAATAFADARDEFDAAIAADAERAAGIFHHYEFGEIRDTPPPEGYAPFYISHYGRHGSRYQARPDSLRAYGMMEAAEKAGVLTADGLALLGSLKKIVDAHDGMYEILAARGADEHKRLARRMQGRFPEVFAAPGGKVRCQSSTYPRCLLSMANFSCGLKGAVPGLDFEFLSGKKYMNVVLHSCLNPWTLNVELADELREKYVKSLPMPRALLSRILTDSPAAGETIGDPRRFAVAIFEAASAYQSLAVELDGLDIYRFFTHDELVAFARYENFRHYLSMGNSEEFGEYVTWAGRTLAADVMERADAALAGKGPSADLRFGHDSGLWPLVSLLGVEGAGARVPAAESPAACPLWREMPMAANIQIVFYRKEGAEPLVKVLYNERESQLAGLKPFSGPYFRWSDFRALLAEKSSGATPPQKTS